MKNTFRLFTAALLLMTATSSIALADNALQRITVEEVTSLMAGKQAARFRGFLEKINLPGLEKVELMKDPVYVHRALTTRLNDRALNPALAKEISKIRKLNRTASSEANHVLNVRSSGSGVVVARRNEVGTKVTPEVHANAVLLENDRLVKEGLMQPPLSREIEVVIKNEPLQAGKIGPGYFTVCKGPGITPGQVDVLGKTALTAMITRGSKIQVRDATAAKFLELTGNDVTVLCKTVVNECGMLVLEGCN